MHLLARPNADGPGKSSFTQALSERRGETVAGIGQNTAKTRPRGTDAIDLGKIGPMLEHHPLFPARANISLARVDTKDHITLKVWERGAGLTRACGSAACATAVAAARLRRTERTVVMTLPGGELTIEWRAGDDHVLMTGPAAFEYEGRFDPALFANVA